MLIYLRVTLILASGFFFFLGGWGGITFTCVFCFVLFVFNCFFGRTIVTRDLLGMGWHENKQVRSGAVVGLFP